MGLVKLWCKSRFRDLISDVERICLDTARSIGQLRISLSSTGWIEQYGRILQSVLLQHFMLENQNRGASRMTQRSSHSHDLQAFSNTEVRTGIVYVRTWSLYNNEQLRCSGLMLLIANEFLLQLGRNMANPAVVYWFDLRRARLTRWPSRSKLIIVLCAPICSQVRTCF